MVTVHFTGTLFEEGLLNLVAEALRLNPEFTYLLKALKIESWNGKFLW